MAEKIIYLDSSAIVKRYVEEPGSNEVRSLYKRTYAGDVKLAFSIWNIGEVLGALDKACIMNRLGEEDYMVAKKRFLMETARLIRLGVLLLVQIKTSILKETWKLIEKYHIYQADALQIASAKTLHVDQVVVSDKKLYEIILKEGLNAFYLS